MNIKALKPFWLLLITAIVISSCEKDEAIKDYNNEYLKEYELVDSYTQEQVLQKLVFVAFAFPEFGDVLASISDGVDIYKVTYNTSLQEEAIVASGLVCIPKGDKAYPFLSFQNGTNTCHSNAPSVRNTDTLFSMISVMAGAGFIITIPDYIGFGESEQVLHPFHHKASSDASIINLLKAADELLVNLGTASKASEDLMLIGYSQGGWATMSVLKELETNSANTFNVKAAACGAGAYNLRSMSEHVLSLEEYGNPFYLPYFIEPRRQLGILTNPLSDYFKAPYADIIPGVFDGTYCNTQANTEFTNTISELMSTDMINNFDESTKLADLRDELDKNSITAWNVKADLRMYHSSGDKSVPSFLSKNLYDDFIELGVSSEQVELEIVEFLDHNDAILPWGIDAITWLVAQN